MKKQRENKKRIEIAKGIPRFKLNRQPKAFVNSINIPIIDNNSSKKVTITSIIIRLQYRLDKYL